MFILMWAGGMSFNGETILSGKSLGGSETAAYYVAKELAKLGHNVTMFTASQQAGKWDGVTYEWHGQMSEQYPLGERFHFCAQVPFDVCIIQRHPLAYASFINAKIRVLWNHDLALHRNIGAMHRTLPFLDFIFGVSNWHADQIAKVYEINRKHVIATSNGVDYELFGEQQHLREPMSLLYTARPERGLENLVKPGGIMERLPECKLYVCGYDNTMPQMVDYYQWLWSRCEALPNVTNLGPLGKKQLYEWEQKVMLHVYPTTFEDTSCIAAMEAQAAGTPFIASQIAALPETCRGAGAILLPLMINNGRLAVSDRLFIKTVKRILASDAEWKVLHEKALAYRKPWDAVAKQWIDVFEQRFAENCSDSVRLAKHLERYSDIIALDKLADKNGAAFKILNDNYKFYLEGTYEDHYTRYYQYEKNRGVVYGPESLDGNNRFEAICSIFGKALEGKDQSKMRVLDYGCAHGHYVMNLRKRFPQVGVWVGIDIDQSNIDTAKKWAEQEKAENVSFIRGTSDSAEAINEKCDIIMANEVLEHVPNPQEVADKLKTLLKDDGLFIASVPYGPWEAIGYKQHPGWRAHLHHFERQDLIDMFNIQPDYRNIAVPHMRDLGHYVVQFNAGGPPIGAIDYGRKLRQQAPQQTISVCMLAKDEEFKIGQCLKKLEDIADEIIVGLDKTTTDKTRDVLSKFSIKIIDIDSPLQTGFDEARNTTIVDAASDWILWIDADEQLENADGLLKYLHSTPVDGIAIPQHHLGVNPPGVQKTDLPCRLFRNHRGMRFFGVVHEHPEKELNGGAGMVIVADSTAIGHYGYSTEVIRRKRFERNFPLMQLDRKKHPERKLGIMLWVRDLAHVIRYEREKSRGHMTQQAMNAAIEVITTWQSMLKWKREDRTMRMLIDALPYYSEAVNAMGHGGVEMAINIGATPYIGNGGIKLPPQPVVGLFASTMDAKVFAQIMTEDVLALADEHYL